MARPIYSKEDRVYWNETDAARIAHFSSIFKYCEEVEEEFFASVLGARWKPGNPMFPRVHASCDFKAPLRVHDRYRVEITDIIVGEKSITYRYRIVNLDLEAISAECTIVTVAIDPDTFQPIRVPIELREALLRQGARMKA